MYIVDPLKFTCRVDIFDVHVCMVDILMIVGVQMTFEMQATLMFHAN